MENLQNISARVSTIVRMSPLLLENLKEMARKENVSLNGFIVNALKEKISDKPLNKILKERIIVSKEVSALGGTFDPIDDDVAKANPRLKKYLNLR